MSEKHVILGPEHQRCRISQSSAVDVQDAYSTLLAQTAQTASGSRETTELPARYAQPNGYQPPTNRHEFDVHNPSVGCRGKSCFCVFLLSLFAFQGDFLGRSLRMRFSALKGY